MFAKIEAQPRRRFLKSHLPLDALPYNSQLRYIVTVRDPRDVFMSFWNHYSQMTEALFHTCPTVPVWGGAYNLPVSG